MSSGFVKRIAIGFNTVWMDSVEISVDGNRMFISDGGADGAIYELSRVEDPSLGEMPLHPADNDPQDSRITIGEVTAYGAAWKSGTDWPIGPNPIPASYVTRAGALWKGGETYIQDQNVSEVPLNWVNGRPVETEAP